MKRYFMGVILIGAVISLAATLALAQDMADPALNAAVEEAASNMVKETMDDLDGLKYGYGTVVSAADDKIVILGYDFEKDEEVEVSYAMDPQTKLNNIAAVTELVKNDVVEIYYEEKDGQKTATSITKEIIPAEEEEIPGEDIEDMPEDATGTNAVVSE